MSARGALSRLVRGRLERFLSLESASGVVLLVAAALAMLWANSPWSESYRTLFESPRRVGFGAFAFERSFAWFVNDGAMVLFFFVVGLEIRREMHGGALADAKRAALPAMAALGGMLVPASVYLVAAGAPETRAGWGVPMATDIAFAVGILSLLGKRVPASLRVVLLALAVIDDLGAIVVIALFYSGGIEPSGLLLAGLALLSILGLRAWGVEAKLVYVLPGLLLWAGVYRAGIHPTIAGVLLGLLTPVRSANPASGAASAARSPATELIEILHPWVAFGIMPLFALANSGVALAGEASGAGAFRVTLGVVLGLVAGKPVGILCAIWLTLRFGIGTLPPDMRFRHLVVLGTVAGVGFTMALFVAQLAFAEPGLLAAAKRGVLAASAAAALLSLALGRLLLRAEPTSAAVGAN